MSDKALEAKLAQLEKSVQEEQEKLAKSANLSLVVYGILVLVVFGYTNFCYFYIKGMATPKHLVNSVQYDIKNEYIPQLRKQIREHTDKNAGKFAAAIVEKAHSAIPQVEELAKVQLDILSDEVIAHTKKEYLPRLKSEFQKTIDHAHQNRDIVRDKDVAKALSALMVEGLDKELDKMINEKFINRVRDLKNEVDFLAKTPKEKLTKKQDAERRAIISWLFLLEHGETGHNKIIDTIRFVDTISKEFHFDLSGENEEDDPEHVIQH